MNHLPDRLTGEPWVRCPPRPRDQPHERVARLQQREEHGLVRLRAGMRLHIGEAAIEQPARPLDRQFLGDVDIFAAAVVATAGIAFGIFVGQHRALGFQHRPADDVLGGDQLDLVVLPAQLIRDGARNRGVAGCQVTGEKLRIPRSSRVRQRHHSKTPSKKTVAGLSCRLSRYPYPFTKSSARPAFPSHLCADRMSRRNGRFCPRELDAKAAKYSPIDEITNLHETSVKHLIQSELSGKSSFWLLPILESAPSFATRTS